jgi:C-terminal processing protease CtpA/Prc
MRMAFGLVSVLVTIGVIALVMNQQSKSIGTAMKAKQDLEEKGVGTLNREFLTEVQGSLSAYPPSGKFKSLMVDKAPAGGGLATHFGLQPGDQIVAVAGNTFDATAMGDAEMAILQVFEARGRKQTLTVKRGGQTLELPQPPGTPRGPALQGGNTVPVPTH